MALSSANTPSILDQQVSDVDWRIDVLVSSSHALRRVAVPTVLLTLTLSSGVALQFRLTQADLHQWRFVMAKAVRDLAYLEKKRPANLRAKKVKK